MSDGGARIFKGFPLAKELATAEGLRELADHVEAGNIEIWTYHLRLRYYSEAKNEEGYILAHGETFSPTGRYGSKA